VAAIEWRDPWRTIFNRDTVANGRFNLLVLAAFALTFLATTISGLNRLLDTVELDGHQWRACLVAVIGYLVLAEVGKLILRRVIGDRGREPSHPDLPTHETRARAVTTTEV
jgi:Ca2+-transporting ATPase